MQIKTEQEITQIGNSILIKGDVIGKSDIRIAGTVNGNINIEGELIVERTGHVEGEIKSNSAVIAGLVKGNIECKDKLVLESSSQFMGNIKTKCLVIQEGVIFQGNCQMGVAPTSTPTPTPGSQAKK